MKLIRCGQPGAERPGIQLSDGSRLDVSAFGNDYDEAFFGGSGIADLAAWLKTHQASCPTIGADVRLGPPLVRPSKIICVGLNYRDHARESQMELPKEPVLFFKSTTALCGPNDSLVMPRAATKVDWEVELAVVIGRRASYVTEADAYAHVAGYALHNDYSERAFQLERGGQWVKGKSCDTFAPLGPFIATRDEVADPMALKMWLSVNGEMRQNGSTANMVFGVATLVSYISQFMTLLPGDIISTGTPAGVALGCATPVYLKVGDTVELGMDQLGQSRQVVVPSV
jgi:2-keto-4-pentenoate hydratase/2-oxohepta-3-ene-1,7-dioic acid hydratase in catechol pathway